MDVREIGPSEGMRHRAALGLLVLALTSLLSNAGSLPLVPGDAFDQRLAISLVREVGAAGYFAQLAAGIWLALALIFGARRGARGSSPCWRAPSRRPPAPTRPDPPPARRPSRRRAHRSL